MCIHSMDKCIQQKQIDLNWIFWQWTFIDIYWQEAVYSNPKSWCGLFSQHNQQMPTEGLLHVGNSRPVILLPRNVTGCVLSMERIQAAIRHALWTFLLPWWLAAPGEIFPFPFESTATQDVWTAAFVTVCPTGAEAVVNLQLPTWGVRNSDVLEQPFFVLKFWMLIGW